MSDLTQVLKGNATLPQIIQKEVAQYTNNPWIKAFAPILLPLLVPQFMKVLGLTSTTAWVLVNAIEAGINGQATPGLFTMPSAAPLEPQPTS